jgi:hypothetical protein
MEMRTITKKGQEGKRGKEKEGKNKNGPENEEDEEEVLEDVKRKGKRRLFKIHTSRLLPDNLVPKDVFLTAEARLPK